MKPTETSALCADLNNEAGRAWRCLLDPALHGHVDEELQQIQDLLCLVGVRLIVLIPLLEVLKFYERATITFQTQALKIFTSIEGQPHSW